MTKIQFLKQCVGKDITAITVLANTCLKDKTAKKVINALTEASEVCEVKAKEFYVHRYSLVNFGSIFCVEGAGERNYATYAEVILN